MKTYPTFGTTGHQDDLWRHVLLMIVDLLRVTATIRSVIVSSAVQYSQCTFASGRVVPLPLGVSRPSTRIRRFAQQLANNTAAVPRITHLKDNPN